MFDFEELVLRFLLLSLDMTCFIEIELHLRKVLDLISTIHFRYTNTKTLQKPGNKSCHYYMAEEITKSNGSRILSL